MAKRFTFMKILVILPLFLTGCAAASTVTIAPTASTITVTPTNTVQVTITKTVTETVTATITPVATPATFTGNSDETTAPFSLDSQDWTVSWSYATSQPQYAALAVYVYPVGQKIPVVDIPNAQSPGSTFSYAGPGQYYVQIISANLDSWTVTVTPAR